MKVIEVKGLVKSYGDFTAVAGIDLAIETGEIFALLGPNGAGKTTTVEILVGFRAPDSGSVSVLGFDPATKGDAGRRRAADCDWRRSFGEYPDYRSLRGPRRYPHPADRRASGFCG